MPLTMKRLSEFFGSHPRASFIFAALIGVLFTTLDEFIQKLLLPVVTYLQPLLLDGNSTFLAELVVNCIFQGIIALCVSLVLVPLHVMLLQPKTMFYPFVSVGADLVYSLWWLPINIFLLNKWPFPKEYMPIFFIASAVTSAIFLGSLLLAVRRSNKSS
jgi:hypothetical protein